MYDPGEMDTEALDDVERIAREQIEDGRDAPEELLLTENVLWLVLEVKRLRAMVADNARLRKLVKDAEHGNAEYGCCPWCGAGDWQSAGPSLPHAPTCPAFMPDGMVR